MERFDHSAFLRRAPRTTGSTSQAFTSYEKATQWLLDNDTPEAH
jgi:hypothetical protein